MSLHDDLRTNVFDVAIDYRGTNTANVYVAVRRIGVVVLRFRPDLATPLMEIGRIQTPDYPVALAVRHIESTGVRHLLVNDFGGGIRVFGE